MVDATKRSPRDFALDWPVVVAVASFALLVAARIAVHFHQTGQLGIEDDAFYYLIVAKNLVASGASTFDGQTLTNGYHPLWLLVVALQDLVFGPSLVVTIAIEIVLAAGGLWLILVSLREKSFLFRIVVMTAYTVIAWPMIAKGMEVSLLAFALGLFAFTLTRFLSGAASPLLLGLATALCIGARLDSAVFVVPIALLACRNIRAGLIFLAPLAVLGLLYVGVNVWAFGLPFPVSGDIKSLGGFQLNRVFLQEVAVLWAGADPVRAALSFTNSFVGRPIAACIAVAIVTPFVWRKWKAWPLCIGFLIGFALYALKIVAFSSWILWPWYGFPALLGLIVLAHAADDFLALSTRRLPGPVDIIGGVGLIAGLAFHQVSGARLPDLGFETINRQAAAQFNDAFHGARVAMGDRAGSFAYFYHGPVTQLEGLVNDKAYFEALRAHQDIRPLLCARGVRYVLSYQRDLGAYSDTTVQFLRPRLTQYKGPTLTFAKADEVGRVFDLSKFNDSTTDDGDNYLYAWRLSGCDAAR